ncbi:MAP7 domain-containing protein 2a [Scomber japonicus]|uniref:MAP7 domain-containing protein 2a n=1 Tax=Scomber japonicus TaxID=13676 RepID=UPI002306BFA4|nr:MAP7 domain-containing protein 2a [Scomber japonicus]
MAKTVTSTSAITGEKMAAPSITLLPDKRSPTNSHSSPARTGKSNKTACALCPSVMGITAPSTEKKPQLNGHASPSHLPANISSNHAGKQIAEGYMKTDDRMRLAKERREERERSLAAREQLIREKERRARLQYERTVEERWRRLEEHRQKEELRRAAVEEKRRQQFEEERGRLEALMKRSLERSLQLEQRTKRWSRGCPAGGGDSENAPLPFSAASAFSHGIASPLPAVSESAPCSPHRSPFCSSLNPDRAGLQGGSQSTPNTPKKERLRRERRTASPGCGSPVRRSESPANVSKHLASPTTSKLASKMRAQSPSNAHQYHHSPIRHRPTLLTDDRKAEDKKAEKQQCKTETAVKKTTTDINNMNPPSQAEGNVVEINKTRSSKGETLDKPLKGDTSERNQSPDRKDHKTDLSEKTECNAQDGEKKKESAACMSTGKAAAGTTNAEEATRLLAERRRQARAQKELEEKKREQEEEERIKEEQLRKQLAQEQRQAELKAQQEKEKAKKEEDAHRVKQEEEKREQDVQEKDQQMDKEREQNKVHAQEEAERQRQDRELQTQQEEEERQLRKKRIEEIMKRTRKGEAELKVKEEQVETKSVSPPGEVKTVQTNAQVKEQAIKKVEFQVKEQVPVQGNMKENDLVKKEVAAQMDNQKSMQVKNNTPQVTPTNSVSDKRQDTKQASEGQLNKDGKACLPKAKQEEEVEMNVKKQHRVDVKATDQIKKQPTKTADAKVNQTEGSMMNGAVKGEESALISCRLTAEVSKLQNKHVSTAEGKVKGKSQMEVIRPSVKPLPVEHLSPPIIKLEPLDVKGTGSGDEVQSMEVSPASKEELISIPEFSPVNEIQHSSMSNTRALEDLLDLTGSVTYPKLSSEGNVGDCNKNLIGGVVSPMSDSKLIGMSPPSSNKLKIQ